MRGGARARNNEMYVQEYKANFLSYEFVPPPPHKRMQMIMYLLQRGAKRPSCVVHVLSWGGALLLVSATRAGYPLIAKLPAVGRGALFYCPTHT